MNLEQFIEACGERFAELLRLENTDKSFEWHAIAWDGPIAKMVFVGSTPTEAVQKLYDYLKENNLLNTK